MRFYRHQTKTTKETTEVKRGETRPKQTERKRRNRMDLLQAMTATMPLVLIAWLNVADRKTINDRETTKSNESESLPAFHSKTLVFSRRQCLKSSTNSPAPLVESVVALVR